VALLGQQFISVSDQVVKKKHSTVHSSPTSMWFYCTMHWSTRL